MERATGEHEGQRTSIKQVVSASVVGTALEWYDFSLYGTAAALVFGSQFFPGFPRWLERSRRSPRLVSASSPDL